MKGRSRSVDIKINIQSSNGARSEKFDRFGALCAVSFGSLNGAYRSVDWEDLIAFESLISSRVNYTCWILEQYFKPFAKVVFVHSCFLKWSSFDEHPVFHICEFLVVIVLGEWWLSWLHIFVYFTGTIYFTRKSALYQRSTYIYLLFSIRSRVYYSLFKLWVVWRHTWVKTSFHSRRREGSEISHG